MKKLFTVRFSPLQWAYIAVVLLAIASSVFKNYFSLDEADLLWESKNGPGPYGGFSRFLSEGRPVFGFLTMKGFAIAATLENLKYLRLVSLIIASISCLLIFNFLKNNGVNPSASFLISILIFTLPGFSVFICWAECFPDFISFILSFYAGILTSLAFIKFLRYNSEKSLQFADLGKTKENLYIALAIVLQVISLFNYQTLALGFLLPSFFILILNRDTPWQKRLAFLASVTFIFFLTLGIYYKIYQGLAFGSNITLTARAKFTTAFLPKLQWFFYQLVQAGKLHFLLYKNYWLQNVMLIFLAIALVRDIFLKRFLDILFLFIICIFLFLPMLLLNESWSASRNFTLISAVFIFYIVTRLVEIIRAPSYWVAAPVGLLFTGIMFINNSEGWSKPQHEDYMLMKNFADKLPLLNAQDISIEFLPPEPTIHENNSFLIHFFDEFNDPLFIHKWPIQPGIRVMYKEKHPDIPYNMINNLLKIYIINSPVQFSPEIPGKNYCLNLNSIPQKLP